MINVQYLDSGTASKFDAGVDFTAGVSFIAGDEAGGTGSVPDRLAVYGEQLSDDGGYEGFAKLRSPFCGWFLCTILPELWYLIMAQKSILMILVLVGIIIGEYFGKQYFKDHRIMRNLILSVGLVSMLLAFYVIFK